MSVPQGRDLHLSGHVPLIKAASFPSPEVEGGGDQIGLEWEAPSKDRVSSGRTRWPPPPLQHWSRSPGNVLLPAPALFRSRKEIRPPEPLHSGRRRRQKRVGSVGCAVTRATEQSCRPRLRPRLQGHGEIQAVVQAVGPGCRSRL